MAGLHFFVMKLIAGRSLELVVKDGAPKVYLMEGADGVRSPKELSEWYDMGLRLIGLAWAGTRYCGGTSEPGPLTPEGRELIAAMADYNFILDLSHMDDAAALDSLDRYEGPVLATHANCAALMEGSGTNRHLSDRAIRGLIERDGVIGLIPLNTFLKVGWLRKNGSRREEVVARRAAGRLPGLSPQADDTRAARRDQVRCEIAAVSMSRC